MGPPSYKYLLVILGAVSLCIAQDRGGTDPGKAIPLLKKVLGGAHVSGSIAYWGTCNFHEHYPDFPRVRDLSDYSGSPVEVLRKMFEPDSQMQVTSDTRGGKIRMVEKDVPLDLLDVRIHYISFNFEGPHSEMFRGPTVALRHILWSPEVKEFKTENDIEPPDQDGGAPNDVGPGQAALSGELHDVKLSEALDYVLDIYPGFWVYESCRSDAGQRLAYFYFFGNAPFKRRLQ